jgi:hypothetical protein
MWFFGHNSGAIGEASMVKRVLVIPASEGVFQLSCGDDTLEIQVVMAAPAPSRASSAPPSPSPSSSQASPPVTSSPPDNTSRTVFNPFRLPEAYITAPRDEDGNIDLPELLRRFREQSENPALPDPIGVVLSTDNANLHDISTLHKRIAEAAPHLSFALDFSGLPKR